MSTIIVPCLRISGRATLDWYVEALQAMLIAVYGEGDAVAHSELLVAGRLVMAGTGSEALVQPLGGSVVYVAVDSDADVEAAHERAVGAGAEIVHEPYEPGYGGRETSFRDPDGNYWSFGTYRPDGAA